MNATKLEHGQIYQFILNVGYTLNAVHNQIIKRRSLINTNPLTA